MLIALPEEFNFKFCLQFLQRSPREVLHRVEGDEVIKLLRIEGRPHLFKVKADGAGLRISFLNDEPNDMVRQLVSTYVTEWFDLVTDLRPFYKMAKRDDLLRDLVTKYRGYRIMSHPDLFESLSWAVLGQQINLAFAYTLKQRFVETFGESIEHNGQRYHLFPTPEKISQLKPEVLYPLQFSKQKASYIIGIARAFISGVLSKEKLKGMTLQQGKEELMKIKGIGNWTANYALMRTFRHPDAFPLEDAGLHNAIKRQLGLRTKPSLTRVKKIFRQYKGWEAYATLYLWKSL